MKQGLRIVEAARGSSGALRARRRGRGGRADSIV